jgi:DNA-directed RNA polymerase specialized sigma24 family protein
MNNGPNAADAPHAPKPLTRRSKETGEPYYRRPEVEAQLGDALAADTASLLRRVRERDPEAADFLKEECLVHLIREFARRGEEQAAGEVAEELAVRCMDFIRGQVRRLIGDEYLEDCRNDVLAQTFEKIFDSDTDRADYLEVSFWQFLKRLCADEIQKYGRVRDKERSTDSYDQVVETEGGEVAKTGQPSADFRLEMYDQIRLREGLLRLPPEIRTAFILHYVDGHPVECSDPRVMTVSRYFGKTPRTIRNWLTRGVQIVTSGQGG